MSVVQRLEGEVMESLLKPLSLTGQEGMNGAYLKERESFGIEGSRLCNCD